MREVVCGFEYLMIEECCVVIHEAPHANTPTKIHQTLTTLISLFSINFSLPLIHTVSHC